MMKRVILLCMYLWVFTAACKTTKPATSSPTNTGTVNTKEKEDNTDYILAVVIKAWRNSGDSTTLFDISNISKPEGKLNPGQNDNTGNDYTVIFADENNTILATYYITDPLNQRMEYADEEGNLQTKMIQKDEAYFPMRTNYIPEMKKIIIKKNTGGKDIVLPININ